jgi:hypothetical protein
MLLLLLPCGALCCLVKERQQGYWLPSCVCALLLLLLVSRLCLCLTPLTQTS